MTTPSFTAVDATNKTLQADTKAAKSVKAAHGAVVDFLHAAYPATTPPAHGTLNGRWFPDDTFWNQKIDWTKATKDNGSDGMVAELAAHNSKGIYANEDAWSIAVYQYTAATPTVPVKLTIAYNGSFVFQMPYVHGEAPPPDGGDAHFAALHNEPGAPGHGDFAVTQGFKVNTDGSLVAHSVETGNVETGNGIQTPATGRVAVLSPMGGMGRPAEYVNYRFNHRMRCAINVCSGVFRSPALASDGKDPLGPPAGSILALPPGYSTAGLDQAQLGLAADLSEYGMPVGDSNGPSTGAAVGLFFEAKTDGSKWAEQVSLPPPLLAKMIVLAA